MNKVIILDFGVFLFRSIFASLNNPAIPSTYTCLNMIVSNLKKIGIDPDDKVIVAVDSGKSWRKFVDSSYKANRKEAREKFPIDWDKEFASFDWLLDKIAEATDWNIVKADGLEADDWMAAGSRYFKDNEVILVTYDCLGGDSRIKMADGTNKEIRNIKSGETIVSYNEKNKIFEPNKVLAIHKKEHKIEYIINYENNSKPIRSSENHLFLTIKGWKKAKELETGNELIYHKKTILPKIKYEDSYKLGYILGLAKGDGHINYDKKFIRYEMKDKECLERIQKYVKQIFGYNVKINKSYHKNKKKTYWLLSLYLNLGFDYLIRFLNQDNNSKEFKKGFIAGFYDAEGSLSELKLQLSIHLDNTDERLLLKVKNYYKDLKIETSNIFIASEKKGYKPVFRFVLNSENVVKFLNLCKPSLLRKYPNWKYHSQHLFNGLKITFIRKKVTKRKFKHYDLTIENNHNYIVNNTVLVHNSDLEQCWNYKNVKIFSPIKKCAGKNGKGAYKIPPPNFNVYKLLSKKIEKEAVDNLVNPVLTQADYDKRKTIVNLLELPENIENTIRERLSTLEDKEVNIDLIPFKSIKARFMTIYDGNKVITYEDSMKKRRKRRKKK